MLVLCEVSPLQVYVSSLALCSSAAAHTKQGTPPIENRQRPSETL